MMPNPPFPPHLKRWPNIPLDEHLNYATHIEVRCRCGHIAHMMTEALYAKTPGAVTCSDFHARMKCTRCGLKGWVMISALGR